MWWPWHWDQRAQDEAEERAAQLQDAEYEDDLMSILEAHSSSAEQVAGDSSRDTQNPSDLLIEHKRRAF